jgi:hypothetical protein
MHRPVLAIVLTLASLLAASTANAQTCADGRVAASGYCCWPGQTFDTDAGRCMGPPRCPEGWSGSGADCVRIASATQGFASGGTTGPEASPQGFASPAHNDGLAAAGAYVILCGYVVGAMSGSLLGAFAGPGSPGSAFPNWPVAFVPIAHPVAAYPGYGEYVLPLVAVTLLGTITEIVGIVLVVLGLTDTGDAGPELAVGAARLRFDPGGLALVF